MTSDRTTPVGQLVAERPARARVFERYGIDYCCAGKKTLADACHQRELDPEEILSAIRAEDERTNTADHTDWTTEPLTNLVDHILEAHHAYLRRELPRLTTMVDKVHRVHGERRPELAEVRTTFHAMRAELQAHMDKEEVILFPLIVTLATPATTATVPKGAIAGPIRRMESEHATVGEAIATIRRLTDDHMPPMDACNTYRALLGGLAELEQDLHQHIHKENNVLFPRAAELDHARA